MTCSIGPICDTFASFFKSLMLLAIHFTNSDIICVTYVKVRSFPITVSL